VENVTDGTVLILEFLVPGEGDIPPTVDHIQEDLSGCGIGLQIEMMPARELLAPGPDGPVFGRQFDLALFAWAGGQYQRCQLFLTDEIPGRYPEYDKGWGGVNAPGYSNYLFDSTCRDLMMNPPDYEGNQLDLEQLVKTFQEDLPVLSLFFRRDVVVSRPDLELSGFGYVPILWNVEEIK
jgi:peptide/nickel transport system substrate-binding protein